MEASPKTTDFNATSAEADELRRLLDQGVKFEVPKRSLLRFISKKKTRAWVIREPYLGTLDKLSQLYLRMGVDETKLREDPLAEAKRMVGQSAGLAARAVAVAVLDGAHGWWASLLVRPLGRYFYRRLKPTTLMQLTVMLNTMGNYPNFIASIRLMSAGRTTAPNLVEQSRGASKVPTATAAPSAQTMDGPSNI